MNQQAFEKLTQVIVYLFTTPEKCHHTTVSNSELAHVVMKLCRFPEKVGGFENSRLLCCIAT